MRWSSSRPAIAILALWVADRADGLAFLRTLCADVDTAHVPAIIVSGQPVELPDRGEVLRCQVLPKPFAPTDLLAAVARGLERLSATPP